MAPTDGCPCAYMASVYILGGCVCVCVCVCVLTWLVPAGSLCALACLTPVGGYVHA